MTESSDSSKKQNDDKSDSRKSLSTPYETALNKAFEKLNSEILIFLLAYMILIIGLSTLGSGIPDAIQNLIYLIPMMGIIAYGWLKKRGINGKHRGGRASIGYAGGKAKATGAIIKGNVAMPTELPLDGQANVGIARKEVEVTGLEIDSSLDEYEAEAEYLLKLFYQLDKNGKDDLIGYARKIQKKD